MKTLLLLSLCLVVYQHVSSQSDNTFTDSRDEKTYKTVKIGEQVWMAENLNFDTVKVSFCYDKDSINCEKYGRLYDLKVSKNICPSGWHLPTRVEFDTLLANYGGAGEQAYEALIKDGTSGFNTLFGGFKGNNLTYSFIDKYAVFWSSTFKLCLNVGEYGKHSRLDGSYSEACCMSVRCVKD